MTEPGRHGARCFGTNWRSCFALDLFDQVPPTGADQAIAVNLLKALPERPLRAVSPQMQFAPDGFRFHWNEEAVFDFHAHGLINVMPGSDWRGTLPVAYYSTVAAVTLAWRGMLPMHMSSVVFGDSAWLIAGAAGAGKSTLVAELIAAGGQFLADDLSVLRVQGRQLMVTRGRPSMRLYPSAAALIDCLETRLQPEDHRGKLLAWPRRRAPDGDYRIGGIIILGATGEAPLGAADSTRLLLASVFRPRIVAQTPAAANVARMIGQLANTQRVLTMAPLDLPDPAQRRVRMARIHAEMAESGAGS